MGNRIRMIALVLALGLTGACATVPTGGPVLTGHPLENSDPLSDPYVRMIAKPPQPGATEKDIVEGFLRASATLDRGQSVAREYLAGGLPHGWRPDGRVTVYDSPDDYDLRVLPGKAASAGQTATVELSARHVADITPDGDYIATTSGAMTERFQLTNVRGQWRITGLPPDALAGLLLSRADVARAFRPLNLYFYDPREQTLVPDSIMVPVQARSELATTLVRALLHGPTAWLSPAVRTTFPSGTTLRGSAPLNGGTVTVNLGGAVTGKSSAELSMMSAQLVWTLRQLPEMRQMNLQVNGATVDVPGGSGDGGTPQSTDFADRDPSGLQGGESQPYFVRDGRVYLLAGAKETPADGPAGSGVASLRHPAVSFDQTYAAALSENGDRLYVAGLSDGGKLVERYRGRALTPPSYDRYGDVWFADRRGSGKSDVYLLERTMKRLTVTSDFLNTSDVRALRVARDGTRVAALVGTGDTSKIMIGPIIWQGGGKVQIGQMRQIGTDLAQVSDIAWRDADTLVALGQGPRGAVQPYTVPANGTQASATGYAGPEARTITAAPQSAPLLIGTTNGEIWSGAQDDNNWQRSTEGDDPAYPG